MKSKFVLFITLLLCVYTQGWAQCSIGYRVLKLYLKDCSTNNRIIRNLRNPKIFVIGLDINGNYVAEKGEIWFCIPKNKIDNGEQIQIRIESDNYYYDRNQGVYNYIVTNKSVDFQDICLKKPNDKIKIIRISGTIMDANATEFLKNVVVFSQEFNQPTITNENGQFVLKLFVEGEEYNAITLRFKHPLYKTNTGLKVLLKMSQMDYSLSKDVFLVPKETTMILLNMLMIQHYKTYRELYNAGFFDDNEKMRPIEKEIIKTFNKIKTLYNKNPSRYAKEKSLIERNQRVVYGIIRNMKQRK